jgi:hypothetical protein
VIANGLPLIIAVLGTELVAEGEEEMRDGREFKKESH